MKNSTGLFYTLKNVTLISLLTAMAVPIAHAAGNTVLTDGNSTATINFGGGSGLSGMNQWTINNENQLKQQWFWFGLDSSPQNPLNTMPQVNVINPLANFASATYTDPVRNFSIMIDYTLHGGATTGTDYTSDITENIKIVNNSANNLSIRFYQYSDFNLANNPSGDSVSISQSGIFFTKATQTQGASRVSETIDIPLADGAEAGLTTDVPNTLAKLNSGSLYNLNNNLTAGVGDATWALQWNFNIAAGQSQDVVKDKRLDITPIPEPSIFGLAALGLVAVISRRRSAV
jgi:hypothetical protein